MSEEQWADEVNKALAHSGYRVATLLSRGLAIVTEQEVEIARLRKELYELGAQLNDQGAAIMAKHWRSDHE